MILHLASVLNHEDIETLRAYFEDRSMLTTTQDESSQLRSPAATSPLDPSFAFYGLHDSSTSSSSSSSSSLSSSSLSTTLSSSMSSQRSQTPPSTLINTTSQTQDFTVNSSDEIPRTPSHGSSNVLPSFTSLFSTVQPPRVPSFFFSPTSVTKTPGSFFSFFDGLDIEAPPQEPLVRGLTLNLNLDVEKGNLLSTGLPSPSSSGNLSNPSANDSLSPETSSLRQVQIHQGKLQVFESQKAEEERLKVLENITEELEVDWQLVSKKPRVD